MERARRLAITRDRSADFVSSSELRFVDGVVRNRSPDLGVACGEPVDNWPQMAEKLSLAWGNLGGSQTTGSVS